MIDLINVYISEMPTAGWALIYLAVGWVFAVIEIIRHYVEQEEEIAVRICLWPFFLLAKFLRRFFEVAGVLLRATERFGSRIRDIKDES